MRLFLIHWHVLRFVKIIDYFLTILIFIICQVTSNLNLIQFSAILHIFSLLINHLLITDLIHTNTFSVNLFKIQIC